jgi:hypothetical protein
MSCSTPPLNERLQIWGLVETDNYIACWYVNALLKGAGGNDNILAAFTKIL